MAVFDVGKEYGVCYTYISAKKSYKEAYAI
jgi:hypothetical protein